MGNQSFRYVVGAVKLESAPPETFLYVNSDHLRMKCGSVRAGITRALRFLMDLLQQWDPDVSQINDHMDYPKDKEAALLKLDDIILVTTDEEYLDQEVGTKQGCSEKIA